MFQRFLSVGRFLFITLVAASLGACGGGSATAPETEPFFIEEQEEWQLVWSDEFDGTEVDRGTWTFQLGDGTDYGLPEPGWGNGERQFYQEENATVADGSLLITAREESVGGLPYTSARMRSINKFEFTYGRVEMRAKAAPGQGLWSAIWMMPTQSPYGTWAASGEIDMLEVVNAGTDNQAVFMAAHHGFQWPLNQIVTAPADISDASDWHTYAVEWSGDYIRWYIDGEHLRTVEADSYYSYYFKDNTTGFALADSKSAPFDQDFHLIVNLAIGGNGPGFVNPATVDGATMEVDYIRVYECSYGTPDGVGCNTFADRTLETPDDAEPFISETVLYMDGPETLSWPTGERELSVGIGWDNGGAISVEDDGSVISIETSNSGNAVINAADGQPFELFGYFGAGELRFDMYIDSAGTAPLSEIVIKMDSGFPALGSVALPVRDLPQDEWFSYSIPIRELVENPGDRALNLRSVVNLMVVEPTSTASLKIDNISVKCGHPYRNECGISGPRQAGDGSTIVVLDETGMEGAFWSSLGVGASSSDTGFVSYYESGFSQVTWSNTGEGLLVNFASDDEFGVWFVQADKPGVDLSLYESAGFLRFDLKLPQVALDSGINFKVENEYPDGTGDLSLDLTDVEADVWTSFEIPVSELVASTNASNYTDPRPGNPLDLTSVRAAIVLWPAGPQGGVFFEIRDVRYENDEDAASGICPQPTAYGTAAINGAFGGAEIAEGGFYSVPADGEDWAGFANENLNMYPMEFPHGGTIRFNASVPTGESVDVRFRFEFNPYPDVDPAYDTSVVTVSGEDNAQYTIDIPTQGANTYSSFLMYLNTRDVAVQVSNVTVEASAPPCEEPEAPTSEAGGSEGGSGSAGGGGTQLAPAEFTEAFGGAVADGDNFTFPSDAEDWAGFANMNTDLYPMSFPDGALITFDGAVAGGGESGVRFRFEFNPHPDVDPAYDTESVLVSGTDTQSYSIEVPSQDDNTFSSFLLYLDSRDVEVTVGNVVVTVY